MKILVVEDERKLSDTIVAYLGGGGYLCEHAFTFNEAMVKVGMYDYGCILLDHILSTELGYSTCFPRTAGAATGG